MYLRKYGRGKQVLVSNEFIILIENDSSSLDKAFANRQVRNGI